MTIYYSIWMICWNARTFWNFWRFDVLNLASTEFDLRQFQVSSLVSDPWSFFCANVFLDPKWSISWIFYFVHVVSTFGTSGHGFMASAFRTTDGVKWPRHCVVQRQCRWLLRVPWFLDRHLVVATDVPRNTRKKTKPLEKKCGWETSDRFTGENIAMQYCILYS